MAKPRLIASTKQFDYVSMADFESHKAEMTKRGWLLQEVHEIGTNDFKYKYSATYESGVLVNGINAR